MFWAQRATKLVPQSPLVPTPSSSSPSARPFLHTPSSSISHLPWRRGGWRGHPRPILNPMPQFLVVASIIFLVRVSASSSPPPPSDDSRSPLSSTPSSSTTRSSRLLCCLSSRGRSCQNLKPDGASTKSCDPNTSYLVTNTVFLSDQNHIVA